MPVCRCAAYDWPHRPGGGLCRWPDPPRWRYDVPAGTRGDGLRSILPARATVRRVVEV
ncbi:hypothetical protein GQ464_002335 [Rhodocaloribacter litoris]|uniref:hypothetical protein n=1 Tax=Rhodocaloribacter litoris TaxID=2558931 RepID=UPI001E651250|nr:hypothetical protein [Rhodocaloribacter litoris]QXD15806.1 hypothetical protein GQ464_002335 [Rhodocaloribacter litoris]